MLDKSIPYVGFWMVRESDQPLEIKDVPAGYQLVMYQPGDEAAWCKIETAVGEFEQEADAAAYFAKTFAPYPVELTQRMRFIENPAGEKVATCTAWWSQEDQPLLHWLAVLPTEQGKGLAKVLAIAVTNHLIRLGAGQPVILHTQTWSHPAVQLYEKLDYEIAPIGEFERAKQLLAELKK